MCPRLDKSFIWLRTRTCPRHLVPDKVRCWGRRPHTHLLPTSNQSRLPWHWSSCLSNRMERSTGGGADFFIFFFPLALWSRGNNTVTQSSRALNEHSTKIINPSFTAQEMIRGFTEQLRVVLKSVSMFLASANQSPVIYYITWKQITESRCKYLCFPPQKAHPNHFILGLAFCIISKYICLLANVRNLSHTWVANIFGPCWRWHCG